MGLQYTRKDIEDCIKAVGIRSGDTIFTHANLGFFGLPNQCRTKQDVCKVFVEAISSVIGEKGTWVTPTFSYSYCHGKVYQPEKTGTTCGMLSEYMIENYPYNRSHDPNFSICGIGEQMEYYKECNIHESFGKDCFWERFLNNKGKVLCLNFDSGSTLVHYVEKINQVSYRYNKAFNGMSLIDGRVQKDYAVHFVYDYEKKEDEPCMERLDVLCKENNIVNQSFLGRGTVLAFDSQVYVDYITSVLKKRPRFLTAKE